LDEFDDLMYALKEEYDADGVGGKNFYPFGGGLGASPSGYYILNALGYNTHEPYGERASLRNGEVVIPAYDIEVFQEYLKLMNRWYNDKIINDNYVTITANEVKQQVLDNQTATYNNAPYVAGIDTWTDWRVLSPLTSDWNDTKFWFPGNPVSQGNFAISADTKYPELCLRFADLFYNLEDNPTVLNAGPVMADNLYGFEPVAVYDEETQELINNPDIKGGADSYTYRIEKCVGLELNFGAFATDLAIERYRSVLTEVEGWVFAEEEEEDDPKEMGGDDHYRWSTEQYLMEYITTKYPGVYYVDEETSVKITDLESVIRPHIRQSVGEFITGKREITDDELKKFQKELEALEIKELLQIYTDIYANYKANLE